MLDTQGVIVRLRAGAVNLSIAQKSRPDLATIQPLSNG